MPSIAPPPSFRSSVFAAIAADQASIAAKHQATQQQATGPHESQQPAAQVAPRIAASVSAVASAETDPSLRSIQLAPSARRASQLSSLTRTVRQHYRLAGSLAAMLLVGIITATAVPASPLYLGGAGAPPIAQYTAETQAKKITSVSASAAWLGYAATDSAGATRLFAQNRSGGAPVSLLGAPAATPITVYGVSANWLIWSEGDPTNAWTLHASALHAAKASAPLTLLGAHPGTTDAASDAPRALQSVWAQGDTVLAATTNLDGSSSVLRIWLASTTPTVKVVSRTTTLGHTLTTPTADGATYVWSEVWMDGARDLHGVIWRGDDAGHSQKALNDDHVFAPQATNGALVWVAVPDAKATSADINHSLAGVSGAVRTSALGATATTQIGTNAIAGTLRAAGGVAIWQSGGKTYTYQLSAHAASPVAAQVRDATLIQVGGDALVWTQGATTMQVFDLR